MTEPFNQDTYLAERKAILLSLDVARFRAYLRKNGRAQPSSDEVCLAAMHKARCEATYIPLAEKATSVMWLLEHGYKAGIG